VRAPSESVVSRFLRYVQINTEASEGSTHVPSSPGQWDLARLLVTELKHLGVSDVRLSDACIVYASIPATPGLGPSPAVGFIAHVDTSPAASGANVKPIVHANYQGGDIVLPADASQVIRVARCTELRDMVGDDIITADGTTLLGSDDKAGVAIIMTLVDTLANNPDIPHGRIAVAFTSDEEIGRGVDHFDIGAFGANFAFTIDGDALGEVNVETWNALGATVIFSGVSAHTGTAKGEMVNSIYAMADFLAHLPADLRPEATEGRVGFIHANTGELSVETSRARLLLRDFDVELLAAKERLVRQLAADVTLRHPGVSVDVDVKEQYRNMFEILEQHPELQAWAFEAARRAGVTPRIEPIRGGTDGARLTFLGLPCPNLFTGGHNFHSKFEFNSGRGLERSVDTLMELVALIARQP
jgi:tripeptide aminopeptidase